MTPAQQSLFPLALCVILVGALEPHPGLSAWDPSGHTSDGVGTVEGDPVYLELHYDAETVVVRVNGVPVARPPADRSTYLLQLGPFLVEGENTLTVQWRPSARPRRPVTITVLTRPGGRPRGGRAPLAADTITPEPRSRELRERTLRFRATPPVAVPWRHPSRITDLAPTDRRRILRQVRGLRDAIADRSPERLMERVEPALLAMSGGDADLVERAAAHYRNLMSAEGFRLCPLPEDALDIEPYGRLTVVSVPSEAVVRTTGVDGGSLTFRRLFFAKIEGRWELVATT
jgi:hypothetical protein